MKTILNMPSMAKINKIGSKSKLKAVSFFSGMGGASIGMKLAGFNVIYANEFVPSAADCYEANSNLKVDRSDVRKVDPAKLLKQLKLKRGELDLLEGSPPCKAFSTGASAVREKNFNQEIDYSDGIKQRVDDLFFEYIRMIDGLKPKVFIAENVYGLLSSKNRGYLQKIVNDMKACGYKVDIHVLDASWLGVPQARRRVIFIGLRNDLVKKGYVINPPSPYPRQVTVGECLPHIARIKASDAFVPADRPSPTITSNDLYHGFTAEFSSGCFCETVEGELRRYTLDELKVISGVPKDFKMTGRKSQNYERLGRIHIPLQVYHICVRIKKDLLEPLSKE